MIRSVSPMPDSDPLDKLKAQIGGLLEVLTSNTETEPLRGVAELARQIEEAAGEADLSPPVAITGRGMSQSLRMRSPFHEAVEDAGFGPGWKRLLGEKTYQAHGVQIREKLLYYLSLWRGWLADAPSTQPRASYSQ
jgi:hypothetical protein